MSDPIIDRREPHTEDGAYVLAILFTIGYFAFLGVLMFYAIPDQNKELMLTLAGILSAAMLGIVKYFYDGSKSADKVQSANIARSVKSEAVVQDIAKAAAPVAAAAVAAATGAAPPSPPTGSIQTDAVKIDATNVTVDQPSKGTPP
jgi:hypothetical protein